MKKKYHYFARYTALFVLALFVTGCTSNVRTKISTFIEPNAVLNSGSIAVKAFDEKLDSSVEFKFYKAILEEKLVKAGYTINNENPSSIAQLGYNVTRKETDRSGTVVVSSGFGYSGFYNRGGLLFSQQLEDRFDYERMIKLTIVKKRQNQAKSENILEISARSLGSCESLPAVFEPMLNAIFADLSRPTGSLVTVKTAGKGSC